MANPTGLHTFFLRIAKVIEIEEKKYFSFKKYDKTGKIKTIKLVFMLTT